MKNAPRSLITRRGFAAASTAAALGTGIQGGAQSVDAPRATWRIDHDTAITSDLVIPPGTQFDIAAGAVLTLAGDLVAPAARLFTGAGRVDLTRSRVIAARPEWWGAVADDATVDCAPALHACLAAHLAMQLGAGDYHLAQTLRIDRPNRRIWGIGRTKDARGTRLLRHGGRGAVVLVGTDAEPATVNAYLRGVDLRWVELGRTAAAAPPPDDPADAAVGLAVRHVLDCVFDGLRANEHAIGFSLRGAVRTFVRDCNAFRSAAGNDGRDVFIGFDMDGRTPPAAIGTGANASLYVIDCDAGIGGYPKLEMSAGCRLLGALSDTYIENFETTDLDIGILVDGRRDALGPGQRGTAHVDLRIRGAVLDQCKTAGISLTGLSEAALVDIGDPYVALAPPGRAAISVTACGGNIAIDGGQLLGHAATRPDATGIDLRDTSGVSVTGTKLLDFARPVAMSATTAFEIAVAINNPGAAIGPAITLADCHNGFVRPRLTGAARVFATGVAADAACSSVEIATAAIVPSSLAGPAVTVGGTARRADSGRVFLPGRPPVA